jgi:hypothetical protein
MRQWKKREDNMAALHNNCSSWSETAIVPRVRTMHDVLKRRQTMDQVFFKAIERVLVFSLG